MVDDWRPAFLELGALSLFVSSKGALMSQNVNASRRAFLSLGMKVLAAAAPVAAVLATSTKAEATTTRRKRVRVRRTSVRRTG